MFIILSQEQRIYGQPFPFVIPLDGYAGYIPVLPAVYIFFSKKAYLSLAITSPSTEEFLAGIR